MRVRTLAVVLTAALGFVPARGAAITVDVPDPYFQDTDGDGIDGQASHAVFVNALGGVDSNPGTMAQPVQTIAAGIAKALTLGKDVYVSKGTYNETVTLVSGVSLYGEFDAAAGWSRAAANTTTIAGGTTAVVAANITLETHI